jgi:hypothetical protein
MSGSSSGGGSSSSSKEDELYAPAGEPLYRVQPRKSCPHVLACVGGVGSVPLPLGGVGSVPLPLGGGVGSVPLPLPASLFLSPEHAPVCEECGLDEVWRCLEASCGSLRCSRYREGHAAAHAASQPSHCVAISLSDLSIWCFACNDYLDVFAVRELHEAFAAVYRARFGEEPKLPGRGGGAGGAGAGAGGGGRG